MKKIIPLFSLFFLLSFANQLKSQIPQYTLEAKNYVLSDEYTMKFDLIFTKTDDTPLQLAGWQFFFRVPQTLAVFSAGFGSASAYMLDTSNGVPVSDLPESFRPRGSNVVVAANSPGNYEFRLAANSLPGCGNGLIIPKDIPILIGRYNMKASTIINPNVLLNNPIIFRDSCESPLSVTRTKINWYDANNCLNKEMTRCANHNVDISGVFPFIQINLKLSIEGLYNPVFNRLNRKDSVTAYLRNVNSPYQIIDSSKGLIDSSTLSGNYIFYNRPAGTYYISVKNKNGLETWSEQSGTNFQNGTNFYDFTISASKAYGNNLVLVGDKYCIYSGNFNYDNIIDTDDLTMLDNDLYNYAGGNSLTNINGDDIVDIDDLAIVDKNAGNFVLVKWPGQTFQKRKKLLNNKTIARRTK
ncbi:MAG TPA: hypothetical protein PK294_00370 [Ignavibacteria bacterium]|nr:hypothetical protein [Ignavibacteria bacterium]HQY53485.1 hypothetical protein [Ignavibacteria bacterium]HRA98863.1 hypothetical protein [Ignavibacteria bacterium]